MGFYPTAFYPDAVEYKAHHAPMPTARISRIGIYRILKLIFDRGLQGKSQWSMNNQSFKPSGRFSQSEKYF